MEYGYNKQEWSAKDPCRYYTRIDILALQEIRWIGQNILEKRECNIYYSCHNKFHQFRTGLIVNKRTKQLVIDIQPVNWRQCKLRIRGRLHNFSLIRIQAPTEDKNENQKHFFMSC
jgi:hypothetical protein